MKFVLASSGDVRRLVKCLARERELYDARERNVFGGNGPDVPEGVCLEVWEGGGEQQVWKGFVYEPKRV